MTYGLLRLYTTAWVDESAYAPVYIARHGRIFQVVLPHHAHHASWGGLFQSATVVDSSSVGRTPGDDDSDDFDPTDIEVPEGSLPTGATTGAGTGNATSASAGNIGPLPGDGTVTAGTPTGSETSDVPLPPATGDVPDAGATASGAAATGATLLTLAAGAAVTLLQLAVRA